MLKLYTSIKYFKPEEIIIDNESFFNNNIMAKSLSEAALGIMEEVDKAKLLDRNTGKIETPYGIAQINDLSTGCKTILNAIYITENPNEFPTLKAICATECGWNAIEQLFEYLEKCNLNISLVIEHDNDLYKCSDREYLVNDERQITQMLFYWGCA